MSAPASDLPATTVAAAALPARLVRALARFETNGDADPVALITLLIAAIRPRWGEAPSQAVARYTALVQRLETDPAAARAVRLQVLRLLATRRMVGFFADSGILPATGFFSELGRIVAHRLLPELPDEGDLRGCVHRIFHRPRDWVWLNEVPPELSHRFWQVLAADASELSRTTVERTLEHMLEALLVLAYRAGGLDVEQEFGRLGARFAAHAARFRALAAAAQQYVNAYRARLADDATPHIDEAELLVLVDQCEETLDEARRASLRLGTDLRLTHLLRRTAQTLSRITVLARLLASRWQVADGGQRDATVVGWSDLMREALRAENRRNSVREHLSSGVALLARRVADNAAKTCDHYVAADAAEYGAMWRAAMGAGLIIAVMALLKIFASGLDLAPAGYAAGYSLIYGLGFVLIYMLHFTVATKQPAMTAQTIASYLGAAGGGRGTDLERVVDLIAAVARSQLAAILGNVLVALPTAMLIAGVWMRWRGAPIVDEAKAQHLLQDLHPLGWSIPHAALAGVFLFFSGLLSGYFDNKASYARIGARVAGLRWLRWTAGQERARALGEYVESHLGGLMGNFLFGCMLGSAGTLGLIFGLPLDIRHIAFASANYGYALVALQFELPLSAAAVALLGVGLIGLTNLAVSFSLALWMALKARGVVFRQARELLRRLAWRFKLQPSSFVLYRPDLPPPA